MKRKPTQWRRQIEQQQMGGGGTTAALPSVPAATPPATETSAEAVQASTDLRRQALKKRGFMSTYQAGDTGGWFAGNTTASPGVAASKSVSSPMGPGAKTIG